MRLWGIEPQFSVGETDVLPLDDNRVHMRIACNIDRVEIQLTKKLNGRYQYRSVTPTRSPDDIMLRSRYHSTKFIYYQLRLTLNSSQ